MDSLPISGYLKKDVSPNTYMNWDKLGVGHTTIKKDYLTGIN